MCHPRTSTTLQPLHYHFKAWLAGMVSSSGGYRFFRGVRSICVQLTTFIAFSLLLTWVFILYKPSSGPGLKQRISWQAWEVASLKQASSPPSRPVVDNTKPNPATDVEGPAHDVDWWNVTQADKEIDYASLPLDVWSPLLPHNTGCEWFLILYRIF